MLKVFPDGKVFVPVSAHAFGQGEDVDAFLLLGVSGFLDNARNLPFP